MNRPETGPAPLLLWGILPGSTTIIGVLVYIVLLTAALIVLRRQVTREFPAAHA